MTEEFTKTCRLCGKTKPISDFPFRKDNQKYRNECKSCRDSYLANYRATHKARAAELNKKYRIAHAEELADYSRNYQKAHLDKFREYNQKYRDNLSDEQKDLANERSKRFRDKRKDEPEYREKLREWNRQSSRRRRKKITAYEEARKLRDPIFRLKKQIRNEIRAAFNRRGFDKSEKTEDIVGCDINYLQRHLRMTYLIRYGVEWDGITPVHIDHIKPLASAHTVEEVYTLNRYTNLQLLREEDNLSKGASDNQDSYEYYINGS